MTSPLGTPAHLASLPSPPTSPTSPRTATARIRIKPTRRPDSISIFPPTSSSEYPAERTSRLSQPLSRIVTTEGSDIRSAVASKRRQQSITYYTPSSPSPWSQRPRSNRTLSYSGNGLRDAEPVVNGQDSVSKRSSLVSSSRTPSTRESVSSLDAVGAREREPLTLVEKHVDLLHYIAQKERKCLELRDQLAAHEKELAELKRNWERVVNHGQDPLPNLPLTAGLGSAALDGLKEGVRMITAPFTDLGGVIHELESAGDNDSSKIKPLTHTPRQNSNASSARAKRMGNEHLSMSSTSSHQECMHASDHVLNGGEGETVAVTTAPCFARAGSLNSRMHKRASRVFSKEPTPPKSASASPPTQSPKSANLDAGMSLILAPSPTLVPPLLGALPASATPLTASKSPVLGSTHGPVPMSAGPISSWVDSMGKKLSELQRGQTFSKGQKRASVLLAGVSSTISSALTPGPTATTPAPFPELPLTTAPVSANSSPTKRPPPSRPRLQLEPLSESGSRSYPTYKSMADWLDDDEEQTVGAGEVLIPDSKRHSRGEAGATTTTAVSSFDDDWNW